jgi:hypothetical protein
VIGARQVEILKVLLEQKEAGVLELFKKTEFAYKSVKDGTKAFVRDLSQLEALQAIRVSEGPPNFPDRTVSINLDWPQEIDEGEFLRRMKSMPKGKTFKFLT